MPTNTLTDHACKSARPKDKPYKLFDGRGLFLLVSPSGGKSWRMAYRLDRKPQTATFGQYPTVSLAEARTKRDEARKRLVELGSIAEPKPRRLPTFDEAVERYWEGRKDVTAKYVKNALSALNKNLSPLIGSLPVDAVTKGDMMAALRIMDAKGLHSYVRKVRLWASPVFDWADEQYGNVTNPCNAIDPEKAFGRTKTQHYAALQPSEVREFMSRLEFEGPSQQSVLACKLMALTWVRTKELRLMTWDQIEGDVWVAPPSSMKKGLDHLVPLSRQAKAIIDHMKTRSVGSRYVFPSFRAIDKPMSENAVLYLIHRMGYKGRMTGHGWRSVASTWANEQDFNEDAIERQLAHSPSNKVRSAYNRAKYLAERRAMLQAWADWLIPDGVPAGPSVPASRDASSGSSA